ncbi:hypothetical protein ACSL103130_01220 [Actinomyces slackii]|uniref:Uncharacterized protein n=1 Tax=Actinomyces slackii TaxID=52774 RepID=A0A3S5EM38_9ACTO|nr:Uncharacterised protein [Actinomyces slackii]
MLGGEFCLRARRQASSFACLGQGAAPPAHEPAGRGSGRATGRPEMYVTRHVEMYVEDDVHVYVVGHVRRVTLNQVSPEPCHWRRPRSQLRSLLSGIGVGGALRARLEPAPKVAAELVRLTDGIPFLMQRAMTLAGQGECRRCSRGRSGWSVVGPALHIHLGCVHEESLEFQRSVSVGASSDRDECASATLMHIHHGAAPGAWAANPQNHADSSAITPTQVMNECA